MVIQHREVNEGNKLHRYGYQVDKGDKLKSETKWLPALAVCQPR